MSCEPDIDEPRRWSAGLPEVVGWALVVAIVTALGFAVHIPPHEPPAFRFVATGREQGTPIYSAPRGEVVGALEDWQVVLGEKVGSGWAEISNVREKLPGPYAKLGDLAPASRDTLRTDYWSEEGGIEVCSVGTHFRALVLESDSENWTVLCEGLDRHYWWIYRENEQGAPELEFSRATVWRRLLTWPVIDILEHPLDEGAPRIAEFWPPLTVQLWRWDGASYVPSSPTRWDEAGAMAWVVMYGYVWWITALVGFLLLWALWLRTTFAPAAGALAFLVWAGSFATLWGFPVFVVLNVAGLVYLFRTPRIGCERALAGILVLVATSLILCYLSLLFIL